MMRAAGYALTHAMRRMWSRLFCLTAALALAGTVSATDVTFNGQTISYTNAETNWVDGELVLIYTNILTDGSLTLPAYTKARLLVVAGGGAGASPASTAQTQGGAGGGGAGGLISADNVFLESGDYTLTVGAGGATVSDTTESIGANGGNSIIMFDSAELYNATGGGGGGIKSAGTAGGSGGGGSRANGGAGDDDQGCKGGDCSSSVQSAGAGGGGAGSDGGSPSGKKTGATRVGGIGGSGLENDITGESIVYAGGGGGGTHSGTGGTGGTGGGGKGASAGENGAAGTDGLGGGGGGGSLNKAGGKGGDGVIIIRLQQVMPEKPKSGQTIPYDGEEHSILEENEAYTISGTVKASATGTYETTVALNEGYYWADGTMDSPITRASWRSHIGTRHVLIKKDHGLQTQQLHGMKWSNIWKRIRGLDRAIFVRR